MYVYSYESRKSMKEYVCIPIQPVPEKMRLEMVDGMQTEILDAHPRSLSERLI